MEGKVASAFREVKITKPVSLPWINLHISNHTRAQVVSTDTTTTVYLKAMIGQGKDNRNVADAKDAKWSRWITAYYVRFSWKANRNGDVRFNVYSNRPILFSSASAAAKSSPFMNVTPQIGKTVSYLPPEVFPVLLDEVKNIYAKVHGHDSPHLNNVDLTVESDSSKNLAQALSALAYPGLLEPQLLRLVTNPRNNDVVVPTIYGQAMRESNIRDFLVALFGVRKVTQRMVDDFDVLKHEDLAKGFAFLQRVKANQLEDILFNDSYTSGSTKIELYPVGRFSSYKFKGTFAEQVFVRLLTDEFLVDSLDSVFGPSTGIEMVSKNLTYFRSVKKASVSSSLELDKLNDGVPSALQVTGKYSSSAAVFDAAKAFFTPLGYSVTSEPISSFRPKSGDQILVSSQYWTLAMSDAKHSSGAFGVFPSFTVTITGGHRQTSSFLSYQWAGYLNSLPKKELGGYKASNHMAVEPEVAFNWIQSVLNSLKDRVYKVRPGASKHEVDLVIRMTLGSTSFYSQTLPTGVQIKRVIRMGKLGFDFERIEACISCKVPEKDYADVADLPVSIIESLYGDEGF